MPDVRLPIMAYQNTSKTLETWIVCQQKLCLIITCFYNSIPKYCDYIISIQQQLFCLALQNLEETIHAQETMEKQQQLR